MAPYISSYLIPVGLSEAAIFLSFFKGSTEPFPQDGEGHGKSQGRLPSRGCPLSLLTVSTCLCFICSTKEGDVVVVVFFLLVTLHKTHHEGGQGIFYNTAANGGSALLMRGILPFQLKKTNRLLQLCEDPLLNGHSSGTKHRTKFLYYH